MDELIEIPHIGMTIKDDILDPLGVSTYKVCQDTNIPYTTLNQVINGKRTLSEEIALKLEKYFGVPAKHLLATQTEFELRRKKREIEQELQAIQPLKQPA